MWWYFVCLTSSLFDVLSDMIVLPSPPCLAAAGHPAAVALMIDAGARLDAEDGNGFLAAHLADQVSGCVHVCSVTVRVNVSVGVVI